MDHVQDTANTQFLLDLMQHFFVPICWFLSWVCVILSHVATWLTVVVTRFAETFWLVRLLRDVAAPVYVLAIGIALIVLVLTYLMTSTGVQVRWARLSGVIRWTVIMLLLVNVGIPLYVHLESGIAQFPPLVVDALGTPTVTLGSVHPTVDGTTYAPFDPGSPTALAQRGSPLAPITARGEAGQMTAFDLTLALWHATPQEVLAAAPGVTVPTEAGPLPIDTMPAGFAATFFPDPASATSGTTDAGAQRRLIVARGRAGSVQAMVGLLASVATLLPALTTLLLVFGTLLTLGAAVLLAPLGLFGSGSLWVGRMVKQWGAFVLWRVAFQIVILLIERLCFGTAALAGIALAWPLTPLVLLIIVGIEWRLFKLAWRILGQGFLPLRQAVAGGPNTAPTTDAATAVAVQHETDGIAAITQHPMGAVAQSGWVAATAPAALASDPLAGSVSGGLGLWGLVEADARDVRRTSAAPAPQRMPSMAPESTTPTRAPSGCVVPNAPRGTHNGATARASTPLSAIPAPVLSEDADAPTVVPAPILPTGHAPSMGAPDLGGVLPFTVLDSGRPAALPLIPPHGVVDGVEGRPSGDQKKETL